MADDDSLFRRRRRNAARAFTARRGELHLTQEDVADRGGVSVRTVQGFEAGTWPNPATRARLEKAVGWPPGEIHRLAGPPQPFIDPQLLDRVAELSDDELDALMFRVGELREARARRRARG